MPNVLSSMSTNFLYYPRTTEGNADALIERIVLNDSIMAKLNLFHLKSMPWVYFLKKINEVCHEHLKMDRGYCSTGTLLQASEVQEPYLSFQLQYQGQRSLNAIIREVGIRNIMGWKNHGRGPIHEK